MSISQPLKAAQRIAVQLPPRCAPHDNLKKGTILRAEGGQLERRVGPLLGFLFVLPTMWHINRRNSLEQT
jgi:hypothetical protein